MLMTIWYQWFLSPRRILDKAVSIKIEAHIPDGSKWNERVLYKGEPTFNALIEALACDTKTTAHRHGLLLDYRYDLKLIPDKGDELASIRVDHNLVELSLSGYSYFTRTWYDGDQSYQILEKLSATGDGDKTSDRNLTN